MDQSLPHDDQHEAVWREWVGIASADRAANSVDLQVSVPALMPSQQGSISAASSVSSVSINDPTGKPMQTQTTTSNSITAVWKGESNRKYPPDVRKGEQVKVLKYGDSDRYYWESMGRDMGLRQTETHRIEIGNTPVVGDTPLNDDNTFFLELDSRVKNRILLKTSQGNGQTHMYQILIDAKNSQLQLCDEANNEILIDSTVPRVRMRNNKGSILDIFDKNILIAAPQDVIIKADRQILISTPTMTQNISGTLAINASGIGITGSSAIVLSSSSIGFTGNTTTTGNVKAGPTQTVSGTTGPVGPAVPTPKTNISDGSSS